MMLISLGSPPPSLQRFPAPVSIGISTDGLLRTRHRRVDQRELGTATAGGHASAHIGLILSRGHRESDTTQAYTANMHRGHDLF
jgi:hypothetical protein